MTEQALTVTTEAKAVATAASYRVPVAIPSAAQTMAALLQRGAGVSDPIPTGPMQGYSRAMVEAIKSSVAKGAPDEELYRFFVIATQYNLSPFLKEIWCVNMAGKDQPPQWSVVPSRDGYLRAARRHPNIKSVTSGVVHDGDTYEIDKVNGHVVHRVSGMKANPGAILGAWCLIVCHDGTRVADDVYLRDVRRPTKPWENFQAQMTEKCAQSKTLKKTVGISDLYTADKIWDAMEDGADALLVDPTRNTEYIDGFPVGAPLLTSGAPGVADPGEDMVAHREAAGEFWAQVEFLTTSVEGATSADAGLAVKSWLTSCGLPPISGQKTAQRRTTTAALSVGEDAEDLLTLIAASRDARQIREAQAAGKTVPPATQGVIEAEDVTDGDDIPPFSDEDPAGDDDQEGEG